MKLGGGEVEVEVRSQQCERARERVVRAGWRERGGPSTNLELADWLTG